ncbi:MAG: DNA polymerase I [Clostridiales bacterium]|jgi:DNA polymerase-1|nr:DNA polymerase I [Clostridiales bacterium]
MDKLILIDGNSLVNRAYFALPPMKTSEGTPSNAVYGFVNMLLKLIDNYQPKYMVVAFDLPGVNHRQLQYDQYKATRKGMPDDLRVQMPLLKQLLQAMEIAIIERSGVEADDLMGSIVRKYTEVHSYIVTADRDCLQLINPHTTVLLTKKGISDIQHMDATMLHQEWGLSPSQIVDYKALCGDASDNIPGVQGIGDKTALTLLNKYATLNGVYDNIQDIKGAQQQRLLQGKDNAYLSYELATIITDIDIQLDLQQTVLKYPFGMHVRDIFVKLSFSTLAKKNLLFETVVEGGYIVDDHKSDISDTVDIQAINTSQSSIQHSSLQVSVVQVDNIEQLQDILRLDYNQVCLHIVDNAVQFVLGDTSVMDKSNVQDSLVPIVQYNININVNIVKHLSFLYNSHCTVVVYDLKNYLYAWQHLDIKAKLIDIRLMQYLVDITRSKDNVEDWASAIGMDQSAIASVVSRTLPLLQTKLQELNMVDLYYNVELPLVRVLYIMQVRGIAVNLDTLRHLQIEYQQQLSQLSLDIQSIAGAQFNVQSPKQLAKVLFEDMGLTYPRKKSSILSTAADILRDVEDNTGIIALILRYRELSKLNNTYVEGLLKLAVVDANSNGQSKYNVQAPRQTSLLCNDENAKTHSCGIVHTDFRQMVVATGRLSSNEPNLQNIPVRTPEGRKLRRAFVSREGYSLICADYSQIELRLLAHLSGDQIMIDAFNNCIDIHTTTASQVFGVSLQQVTSEMRRQAKAVNFGIVYGISDFGLSKDLKISVKQAKNYITEYFNKYHCIKSYLNSCVQYATEYGYVKSILGRVRCIPELNHPQKLMQQHGQRIAMNMPMQGSASDIIKLAMLQVYQQLQEYDAYLIHQVHDELIVECVDSQIPQVTSILTQCMSNAYKLKVPLEVDVEITKEWN